MLHLKCKRRRYSKSSFE